MGLFEQFPFTNFHQLNLDWILQQVKNMSEHAVLSVNGQTGDVVLYQSENIVFPEVDSDQWRMVRVADGHTAGVLFNQDYMYVMYDNTADRVYTMNHPPAYPVTSVDGQTGDVHVFPNAATRLPDVTDDYTNIRRQIQTNGTDDIVGIELKQNKAYRIKNTSRYEMYDSDNPPPYPVTSVNNQTGAVILAIPFESPLTDSVWMASESSADHTAGLARETVDGTVEIYTVTTGTNAAAYISFVSADDQYSYTKKLLTTDDIPSAAGVVSVNGMNGVVTLTGSDLYIDNSHNITIPAALDQLQKDLAILVSGNAAAVNVTAGQYVVVHGSTITGISDGLYTAVNNVSSGTPFTAADLAAVSAGGFNALAAVDATLSGQITTLNTSVYEAISLDSNFVGTGAVRIIRIGKMRVLFGHVQPTNSGATQLACTLSSGDMPPVDIEGSINGFTFNTYGEVTIKTDGKVLISVNATPGNSGKFNIAYAIS